MYKLHLILKYLRKRRIAWVSLIAVMLCTAMVLVVISVMGGWLRMFQSSFRGLTGDIVVRGDSLTGFPYYDEMIEEIEKLPDVAAAVPSISTYCLINVKNLQRSGAQVVGYPLDKIGRVNEFANSLLRQKGANPPKWDLPLPKEVYAQVVPNSKSDVTQWPGMIVGAGLVGLYKDKKGNIPAPDGVFYAWCQLTVLEIDPNRTSVDVKTGATERKYWIVDASRTKLWQADNQTVYVPFDILQRDLNMHAREEEDPDTGQKRQIAARAREIQVAAKPGTDLNKVRDKIEAVVEKVIATRSIGPEYPITVQRWTDSEPTKTFIAAVEKEKLLVTFLFGIVSVVAVFLIFCIFYMIVVEKTKDIGIVKSVGATSSGIAGIFLGYGLAIGIVGAGLGFTAAFLIVKYINEIHTWIGEKFGVQMWSAESYAFDTIPNTMNPWEVSTIVGVAILASVLGALVPAMRAARMHPVEALRWE